MISSIAKLLKRPIHGSRTARWLVILLCLATWRGPIPLVHSHSSEDGSNVELGWHLTHYHQGQLHQGNLGWHLHLLLPWERFECSDSPEGQLPAHDPLTQEEVVVTAPVTGELIANLWNAHQQSAYCRLNFRELMSSREKVMKGLHLPAFHSFTESLLLAAPLCAVTGVALC